MTWPSTPPRGQWWEGGSPSSFPGRNTDMPTAVGGPTSVGGATSFDSAGRLMDLVLGYQRTQVLHAAAALGLADHLAAGPHTVAELAAATGTEPGALGRLVCALSGLGVFRNRTDGRVELTATGELLRKDTPGSLLQTVLAHGEDFYPVWRELRYSVTTGEPAFARVHGLPNWEYRRQHPENNARFDAVMAASARSRAATLLAADRLPDQGVIVDVGGGNGTLLAAVLRDHPNRRGVLLDQPHVVEAAREVLDTAGVADRCEIVAGDFFTSVPAGKNRYVLSGVLLDWGDDRAGQILRRCREAMSGSST